MDKVIQKLDGIDGEPMNRSKFVEIAIGNLLGEMIQMINALNKSAKKKGEC